MNKSGLRSKKGHPSQFIAPISYLNPLAWTYLGLKQYPKAIPTWNRTIERNPDYLFAHIGFTAAHQVQGQKEIARECNAEIMRIKFNFSITLVEKQIMIKKEVDKRRVSEAYRQAGIPD